MMTNLEQQIKEYIKTSDDYILKKAMVYEIFYEYIDMEYETNYETKLTLEDLMEIADIMVQSYFLNEMLCEMIQEKMKDYIKKKRRR